MQLPAIDGEAFCKVAVERAGDVARVSRVEQGILDSVIAEQATLKFIFNDLAKQAGMEVYKDYAGAHSANFLYYAAVRDTVKDVKLPRDAADALDQEQPAWWEAKSTSKSVPQIDEETKAAIEAPQENPALSATKPQRALKAPKTKQQKSAGLPTEGNKPAPEVKGQQELALARKQANAGLQQSQEEPALFSEGRAFVKGRAFGKEDNHYELVLQDLIDGKIDDYEQALPLIRPISEDASEALRKADMYVRNLRDLENETDEAAEEVRNAQIQGLQDLRDDMTMSE